MEHKLECRQQASQLGCWSRTTNRRIKIKRHWKRCLFLSASYIISMITIQSIKLQNFMNIESADLSFEDESINIFYGDNGAGKSAVFEAISVCLTERKRGDAFKECIRHGEKVATIEMNAMYDGSPMYFKTQLINKKGIPPSKRLIKYKDFEYKNSDCTTFLESLNWEHLQHAMFSHQGESNITELRPSDRTKLLKVIFQLELEDQVEKVDEMVATSNQKLIQLNAQKDVLDVPDREPTELRPVFSDKQVEEIERLIEQDSQQLSFVQTQIVGMTEAKTRRAQMDTQYNNAVAMLRSTSARISALTDKIATKKTDIASTKRAGEMSVNSVAVQKEERENCEKQKVQIDENNIEVQKSIDDANDRLIIVRTEIASVERKIEQYKKGVCDHCGQPTDTKQVEEIKSQQLTPLQKEKETLESVIKKRAEKLQQNRTIRAGLGVTSDRLYKEITKEQSNAEMCVAKVARLEEEVRVDGLDLDQTRTDMEMLESNTNALFEQLDKCDKVDDAELRLQEGQIKAIIEERRKQLSDNIATVQINKEITKNNIQLEQDIENNKKRLAEIVTGITAEVRALDTYKETKRILSVELPNYIIVKACNKLERGINDFIKRVRPTMEVKLAQQRGGISFTYKADVNKQTEDYLGVRMASGFEKELLSTAWRVALASAYGLKAAMLDEVDSAASIEASEAMFTQLVTLPYFDQLFIITHKPEVVDLIKSAGDNICAFHVVDGTITMD